MRSRWTLISSALVGLAETLPQTRGSMLLGIAVRAVVRRTSVIPALVGCPDSVPAAAAVRTAPAVSAKLPAHAARRRSRCTTGVRPGHCRSLRVNAEPFLRAIEPSGSSTRQVDHKHQLMWLPVTVASHML
jgi:hypothetical protein